MGYLYCTWRSVVRLLKKIQELWTAADGDLYIEYLNSVEQNLKNCEHPSPKNFAVLIAIDEVSFNQRIRQEYLKYYWNPESLSSLLGDRFEYNQESIQQLIFFFYLAKQFIEKKVSKNLNIDAKELNTFLESSTSE